MSLRTRATHLFHISVDDAYRVYMIVRDTAKGALWLRNWWRTRSAFDKWIMRVAAAHTLIGGLPGVLLGVLAALAFSGPIPPYTSPYYFDWETTFVVIVAFIATTYYVTVGRLLLNRLKRPLRLMQPREVVDQIIKRRA